MKDDVSNHTVLNAVMDRLSKNIAVSHLLQNILPEELKYASLSYTNGVKMTLKPANGLVSGSLSPIGVDDLLRDLLNRAYSEMKERLDKIQKEDESFEKHRLNIFSSPYTTLLLALQNHILTAWSYIATNLEVDNMTTHQDKIPDKERKSGDISVHECILSHGKRLLQTSTDSLRKCFEILTKKPLPASKVLYIRQVMSESFLSV